MAHQFNIPVELMPLRALKPATDAAGRTGSYVSLRDFHKVFVVFNIDQGNAATIALSLSKADTSGGSGAAAVTELVPIYTALDLAASKAFTRQAAAASFTTDAGVKEKCVVFEIDPAQIGKDFIAPVTGASNVANLTSAMIFGIPRYQFV